MSVEYNGLYYEDESFTICTGLKDLILKEITLHPNTKVILNNAFSIRKNLEKVTLNEGLERIENSAFDRCVYLKEINFPSSLKLIGKNAFYCTNIKTLDLSKCINLKLSEMAFASSTICDITLPNNLEKIPFRCFEYNYFSSINLPNSLKEIDSYAFNACNYLKEINLKNIEKIGNGAFQYCTNLENIIFGKNLKHLCEYCFYNCTKLKEIDLSNTKLTYLAEGIFAECTNLEKIKLPNILKTLKRVCLYNTKITKLNLPPRVRTIPDISNNFIECICKNKEEIKNENPKYIKLVTITLDNLLENNKSFKEANNYFKENLDR